MRPSADRGLEHTEDENGNGAADEDCADTVDGRGVLVTRRPNRARAREQHDARDRERVEHRLPREVVQQQSCPHEPDDRC